MLNEVDGKLLTNPKVNVPDWIDNIKFNNPVERKMNIEFDNHTINRKHIIAERNNDLGNVREMKFSFNEKQLQVFAMNELSKFLKKYRYTANASVDNDKVVIKATLLNNPLEYTFTYNDDNGKIVANKIFTTKIASIVNEYPYSEAGLEDSIEDSQTVDLNKPTKVKQASYQYTVMTRYEILQRCNNRLSLAKELIEKNVKEGNIVAIGSNEYASTYDINYLFPDTREQFAGEVSHTAEFVNNRVAKASYENKSANRLAIEASNIINRTFNVYKVVNASRDNDNLYITSVINHNNMRDSYGFVFNIENEKVAKLQYIEDEQMNRFTVAQLLQKFGNDDKEIKEYLNGKDNQIAGGYVYSAKELKAQLHNYISSENINQMIQDWEENNLVTKLNSTTYASNKSLSELVRGTKFRSKNEIENIKKAKIRFGNDDKFYSYETKDNDTRTQQAIKNIEAYKEAVVAQVNHKFKNCDVKMLSKDKFVLSFINSNNKKRIVSGYIKKGNILCKAGTKYVNLDELKTMFTRSKLLSAYVKDTDVDISKDKKIIISHKQFVNNLKDYLTEEQTNQLINDLVNSKKIAKINSNTYVANTSFNNLLNSYTKDIDKNLKTYNLEKANRTTLSELVRHYISDNDTRTQEALDKKEQYFVKAYNLIGKYLNDFDLTMLDNQNMIIAFKAKDNKKRNIVAKIDNEHVYCKINDKMIEIKDLANRFKNSKILSAYLKENNSDSHNKVIISKRNFHEKLFNILPEEDIDTMIDELVKKNVITKISSTLYASEQSFEDLMRSSNLNVSEGLKEDNLSKANKVADKELEAEYIDDTDTRNVEKRLTVSEFKSQFSNALPKHLECIKFDSIKMDENNVRCTAQIFNKNNGLSITAKFDMGIENGLVNTESEKDLDSLFELSTINKTYNEYSSNKHEKHNIILSKREMLNKMKKIANEKDILNTISKWEKTNKISKINSDKYASQYSFEELLSLSDLNAYDKETIDNQFKKAQINGLAIPKEYHIQDSDSKDIKNISDGKSKEYFKQLHSKAQYRLSSLIGKNKISKTRVDLLQKELNQADNFEQLDEFNKKLNRY